MGISVQAYRIIIGSFVSNHASKKQRYASSFKKSLNSVKLTICVLLFVCLSQLDGKFIGSHPKYFTKPNELSPSSNNSYWWLNETYNSLKLIKNAALVIDVNFNARYINGNRKDKGLKITHWNLGSAHLENKVHEIECLVADLRPHLLGISEANYFKSQNIESVMLEDYELIPASTLENPDLNVSRVVIYKHKSIIAKLRKDLQTGVIVLEAISCELLRDFGDILTSSCSLEIFCL